MKWEWAVGGMKEEELVTWYLGEVKGELSSTEELAERRTLCERVIRRLVTTDGVLVELRDGEDDFEAGEGAAPAAAPDKPASAPILVIHPNFALEDEE